MAIDAAGMRSNVGEQLGGQLMTTTYAHRDKREDAYPVISEHEAKLLSADFEPNSVGYATYRQTGVDYTVYPANKPGLWAGKALHKKAGEVKIPVQDGVASVTEARLLLSRLINAKIAAAKAETRALIRETKRSARLLDAKNAAKAKAKRSVGKAGSKILPPTPNASRRSG